MTSTVYGECEMNSRLLCADPLEVAARPKPNGDWASPFMKRLNVSREVNLSVRRILSSFCCLLCRVDLWDSSGLLDVGFL